LLLSLLEFEEEIKHLDKIRHYCELVDTVTTTRRSCRENIKGIIQCFLGNRPIATHDYFYSEMAAKISEIVKVRGVDIIQIEHSFLAPYIDALPSDSNCKKILSFQNLGVYQYRNMLRMKTNAIEKLVFFLKWLLMLRWEYRYAKRFDQCLVVSPIEGKLLQSANPNLPLSLIENGVDTKLFQPLPEPANSNTLLFVGTMGYPPNIAIREMATMENVIVTGYVPDVIPYYKEARICLVPLRAGGGTRLKILESMALGRPVVSTTLGCEGLQVKDQENIMIADTPVEFAQKVVRLLQDRKLRGRISRNARRSVTRHYDWFSISRKMMDVYSDLTAENASQKN
jgi:glycosyltransferase involved in cell wall biosynthesis